MAQPYAPRGWRLSRSGAYWVLSYQQTLVASFSSRTVTVDLCELGCQLTRYKHMGRWDWRTARRLRAVIQQFFS